MNRFLIYLIILSLTIFTSFGDSYLKKAGGGDSYINWRFFLTGLIIYTITTFIWFFIYKFVKFSIVGTVYGVCTAVIFALVGVFYFKESITAIEVLGMFMAILSILILGRFN